MRGARPAASDGWVTMGRRKRRNKRDDTYDRSAPQRSNGSPAQQQGAWGRDRPSPVRRAPPNLSSQRTPPKNEPPQVLPVPRSPANFRHQAVAPGTNWADIDDDAGDLFDNTPLRGRQQTEARQDRSTPTHHTTPPRQQRAGKVDQPRAGKVDQPKQRTPLRNAFDALAPLPDGDDDVSPRSEHAPSPKNAKREQPPRVNHDRPSVNSAHSPKAKRNAVQPPAPSHHQPSPPEHQVSRHHQQPPPEHQTLPHPETQLPSHSAETKPPDRMPITPSDASPHLSPTNQSLRIPPSEMYAKPPVKKRSSTLMSFSVIGKDKSGVYIGEADSNVHSTPRKAFKSAIECLAATLPEARQRLVEREARRQQMKQKHPHLAASGSSRNAGYTAAKPDPRKAFKDAMAAVAAGDPAIASRLRAQEERAQAQTTQRPTVNTTSSDMKHMRQQGDPDHPDAHQVVTTSPEWLRGTVVLWKGHYGFIKPGVADKLTNGNNVFCHTSDVVAGENLLADMEVAFKVAQEASGKLKATMVRSLPTHQRLERSEKQPPSQQPSQRKSATNLQPLAPSFTPTGTPTSGQQTKHRASPVQQQQRSQPQQQQTNSLGQQQQQALTYQIHRVDGNAGFKVANMPELCIAEVQLGGPAEVSGLRQQFRNARIIKVNGRPVRSVKEYKEIAHNQPSFQITIVPPNSQTFQQAINPVMPTTSALPLPTPTQQQRFQQPKVPKMQTAPNPTAWKPSHASIPPTARPGVNSQMNAGWVQAHAPINNNISPPTQAATFQQPRPPYAPILNHQPTQAYPPPTVQNGAPHYAASAHYATNALNLRPTIFAPGPGPPSQNMSQSRFSHNNGPFRGRGQRNGHQNGHRQRKPQATPEGFRPINNQQRGYTGAPVYPSANSRFPTRRNMQPFQPPRPNYNFGGMQQISAGPIGSQPNHQNHQNHPGPEPRTQNHPHSQRPHPHANMQQGHLPMNGHQPSGLPGPRINPRVRSMPGPASQRMQGPAHQPFRPQPPAAPHHGLPPHGLAPGDRAGYDGGRFVGGAFGNGGFGAMKQVISREPIMPVLPSPEPEPEPPKKTAEPKNLGELLGLADMSDEFAALTVRVFRLLGFKEVAARLSPVSRSVMEMTKELPVIQHMHFSKSLLHIDHCEWVLLAQPNFDLKTQILDRFSPSGIEEIRVEPPKPVAGKKWEIDLKAVADYMNRNENLRRVVVEGSGRYPDDSLSNFFSSLGPRELVFKHCPFQLNERFFEEISHDVKCLKVLDESVEWSPDMIQRLPMHLLSLALRKPKFDLTVSCKGMPPSMEHIYISAPAGPSGPDTQLLTSEETQALFARFPHVELDVSCILELSSPGQGSMMRVRTLTLHYDSYNYGDDSKMSQVFSRLPHTIERIDLVYSEESSTTNMFEGWWKHLPQATSNNIREVRLINFGSPDDTAALLKSGQLTKLAQVEYSMSGIWDYAEETLRSALPAEVQLEFSSNYNAKSYF